MKYDTENLADVMQIAPFHRWLGLKIVQQNNDQLELEMPWRDELVSNPVIGAVHGGILASLIDLTGLYAIIAAGGRCQGDRGSEGRLSSGSHQRPASCNWAGREAWENHKYRRHAHYRR